MKRGLHQNTLFNSCWKDQVFPFLVLPAKGQGPGWLSQKLPRARQCHGFPKECRTVVAMHFLAIGGNPKSSGKCTFLYAVQKWIPKTNTSPELVL
jgi:hypothetical protein